MNLELLINEFRTIANDHNMINRFGEGAIGDINIKISDQIKYPILWVIPQGVTLGDNAYGWNLRVLVFDIDRQDDSLRTQILSDTLMTLNDVLKLVKENSNNDFELQVNPLAIPFEQTFVDYCVGWYCDITVYSETMNTLCNIPMN